MSIKLFIIIVQCYYISIYFIYIEPKLIKKSCIFYQQVWCIEEILLLLTLVNIKLTICIQQVS